MDVPTLEEIVEYNFPGQSPASIVHRVVSIELTDNYAFVNEEEYNAGDAEAELVIAEDRFDRKTRITTCSCVATVTSLLYSEGFAELMTSAPDWGFGGPSNPCFNSISLYMNEPALATCKRGNNFFAELPVRITLS